MTIPAGSEHHWRGIRARIAGFGELRAARIDSRDNPAHSLANSPEEYAHLRTRPERCVLPDPPSTATQSPQIPPPSRFERRAGD